MIQELAAQIRSGCQCWLLYVLAVVLVARSGTDVCAASALNCSAGAPRAEVLNVAILVWYVTAQRAQGGHTHRQTDRHGRTKGLVEMDAAE